MKIYWLCAGIITLLTAFMGTVARDYGIPREGIYLMLAGSSALLFIISMAFLLAWINERNYKRRYSAEECIEIGIRMY